MLVETSKLCQRNSNVANTLRMVGNIETGKIIAKIVMS